MQKPPEGSFVVRQALLNGMVLGLVAGTWLGCTQSVTNALPELPVVDATSVSDIPKPVLPPEICVGLVPSEDKWLPETVESLAEGMEADLVGDMADDAADVAEPSDLETNPDETLGSDDLSDFADLPGPDPQAPRFSPNPRADSAEVELAELPVDRCEVAPATCTGAAMPEWELYDFQPRSCGYKATYGLDLFKGRVTVVALLAAW